MSNCDDATSWELKQAGELPGQIIIKILSNKVEVKTNIM